MLIPQNQNSPPPLSTVSTKMETIGEEDNERNNLLNLTRAALLYESEQIKNLSRGKSTLILK